MPWLDEAQGLELSPGLFLAVVGAMYVVAMPAALLLTSRWLRQAQTRHRPAGAPPHPDTWPAVEDLARSLPALRLRVVLAGGAGFLVVASGLAMVGLVILLLRDTGLPDALAPRIVAVGVLVAAAAIVLPPMLLVYTMERARLQWQRDRADNEQP